MEEYGEMENGARRVRRVSTGIILVQTIELLPPCTKKFRKPDTSYYQCIQDCGASDIMFPDNCQRQIPTTAAED